MRLRHNVERCAIEAWGRSAGTRTVFAGKTHVSRRADHLARVDGKISLAQTSLPTALQGTGRGLTQNEIRRQGAGHLNANTGHPISMIGRNMSDALPKFW